MCTVFYVYFCSPQRRLKAIKDILVLHCSHTHEYTEEERFAVSQLQISPTLLHEAKALHARYRGEVDLEVAHLMQSGLWDQAHAIIMDKLVPKAIITSKPTYVKGQSSCIQNNFCTLLDDVKFLNDALSKMEKYKRKINKWNNNGSVG